MKLPKYQLAIFALIITNIVWGASSPIFKWALQTVDPFTFAFFRFFFAALILLPFTLHTLHIKRHDVPKLMLLAFIGFFLHISLLLFGLTVSSSINSPIIASSAPVFLIIGSYFLLHEKIKRKRLIGTILSLIGVIIIIIRPLLDNGLDGTIIGNILFVLSTISFVIYTLLLKEYSLPYKASTITFWMFAISAVIFLPFFLWEQASVNTLAKMDFQGITGIIFAAIFTSVIGYVCYNFAIRYVKANETGVFLYIDPIVTALIAVPLLGEHITLSFMIGSILVFSGIFIAENRIQYHPFQKLFQRKPPSIVV